MRIYLFPKLYRNCSDDLLWTITKKKGFYYVGDAIKLWKFGIYYSTIPRQIAEPKVQWVEIQPKRKK